METVNQVIETTNEPEQAQEPRTFTQEDVDKIVATRLKREAEKYGDYDELKQKAAQYDELQEANKSELQKALERTEALQKELEGLRGAAALREMRESIAKETGVPAELLTADTEDGCRALAQAALAFKKATPTPAYPNVRDAGEVSAAFKGTPQDQFSRWFKDALS